MGLLEPLIATLQVFIGQIFNIPFENTLSYIYTIFNIILLLFGAEA